MKYIIPAVLTFLFGFLLWQVERQKLALDYEVVTSEQFPRQGGVGRYFIVRLRNTGNKEIRDIDLILALKTGSIEERRFSQPNLISQITESPSQFEGHLPLMNPGEVFAVTVTGVAPSEVGPLDVAARAPGATAIPRAEDSIFSSDVVSLLVGILAVGLTALAVSLIASYRTSRVSESIAKIENLGEVSERIGRTEDDLASRLEAQQKEFERQESKLKERERRHEEGDPDAVELIFAVFNRSGIGHLFCELAAGGGDIQYWRTSLFLLHRFLLDEANRDSYTAAAESVVELPAIAPSSRGFGVYLLGKMEQSRGNSERAIYWFEQCRKITPLMHAHLMAQDPAYDLAKVRDYLKLAAGSSHPGLGVSLD